jgi:O-antigen/teichoic acid export membrane protein
MDKESTFERFSSTVGARQDLRRKSVRAFAAILGSSGGEFILRIASTAILARLISPEHFGLFMMVTVVTSIADQFRDLGLSTATIQRESISHREVSNLFWINVTAGVGIACVVCAGAPLVAYFFKEPRLTVMTWVLSACFILGGLTVQHEALLTRQMKHGWKSLVRLAAFLLSTVMAVVMAYYGWGYWALVWREVARAGLIVLGIAFACRWVPSRPDRKTNVRPLLGFGVNLSLTYMVGIFSSCVDRLLIGRYFGPDPVALYRQPYQLVVAPMNQFMSPLYQVALPGLSMLQGEPERYKRLFQKVVLIVAALSMPLSAFLAVYYQEVTAVVLGPQWKGAEIFFLVFALSGFIRSVLGTTGFVLVSRGHSFTLLKLGLIQSVLQVALMAVGLKWGPIGVAVGDGTTLLLMFLPWAYYSFRGSPVSVRLFVGAIAGPAVLAAITGAALYFVRQLNPNHAPIVALTIGMTVASVISVIFWSLTPGGLSELRRFLEDLFKRARPAVVSVAGEASNQA